MLCKFYIKCTHIVNFLFIRALYIKWLTEIYFKTKQMKNSQPIMDSIEKFDKLHRYKKRSLLKYISFNVVHGIFIDTKQFKFYDGKTVTEMHSISYFSTCTWRYLQKVTSCAFVATISYSCENPAWFITNLIVYFSCSHYLIIRSMSIVHVSDLHCNYITTSFFVSNTNKNIIISEKNIYLII